MKKFIRDIGGEYFRVNCLDRFYARDNGEVMAESARDWIITLAKFDSMDEARQWLDNFMRELEDDSPTDSDIRDRLLHLSDALGDIYEKLIGVADDDVISDFGEVLDELDDIIDDIKED